MSTVFLLARQRSRRGDRKSAWWNLTGMMGKYNCIYIFSKEQKVYFLFSFSNLSLSTVAGKRIYKIIISTATKTINTGLVVRELLFYLSVLLSFFSIRSTKVWHPTVSSCVAWTFTCNIIVCDPLSMFVDLSRFWWLVYVVKVYYLYHYCSCGK